MKPLILAAVAALAIAGTARAQEAPKSHEHENVQPPAVAEQKADEAKAEHMCMCCMMDKMDKKDTHAAMQEKMKEMMKNEKK